MNKYLLRTERKGSHSNRWFFGYWFNNSQKIRRRKHVYNFDIVKPKEEAGIYIYCGVSSEESVKNAISEVVKREGGIDVVVNNAGIEELCYEHECPTELWDRIIGVNLREAFLITKYTIPYLLKKPGSSIIYTASAQSLMSRKKASAYVTSKHGLLGLMRSVAVNYAPYIRSNAVCPGQ